MIIQQTSPKDDNSSVYHIFDRINSNGTPLQPQEIRNAIFHGSFQELLVELNEAEKWREIFGPIHKRATDQELILRFLALYERHVIYKKPMKGFLNDYMSNKRDIQSAEADKFKRLFLETVERAYDAFGKSAFRPARSLNVANFDSLMVAIAKHPGLAAKDIRAASKSLLANQRYVESITRGTSDDSVVRNRIELADKAFDARS